ncbi:HD domain-containing phosphohydrolase [Sulfurovum sp.]|uniref:HD-GYP domain-containing protein n=1 Tax=Sulfurovum sp. TaxID=1969726 RepID=UPI0025E133A0|nr:HD domain-containing phosphohydrolase [Sulfurovum sp.]
MNKHINTKISDILKVEKRKSLEDEIDQFRKTISDQSSLEREIIKLFESSLVLHGKDKNQIRQISQISKILGESLGLGVSYCHKLEQAACIYDIGNIMICSEIYKKEDKLSFEEFNVVKNHTHIGYDILIAQNLLSTDMAAVISMEHHEWWDGGGYPRQIKAEQIDIAARIVALADTVGALFTARPGRSAWSYEKILEYIIKRSEIQFDPKIVKAFLINQEKIREVLHMDSDAIQTKEQK